MISRIPRRQLILGQSFTTCLLTVVVVFGGLGAYYFQVFQWRHLEDPNYDLLIVKKTDPAEIAFFRKKTVPDMVDPALQQLARVVKLRKESEKGTVKPEDFDQTCKEVGHRLLEIMNVAKLRQIPDVYQKQYKDVLVGISEVYHSLRSLQESVKAASPTEKAAAYNKSLEHNKAAKTRLGRAREAFL